MQIPKYIVCIIIIVCMFGCTISEEYPVTINSCNISNISAGKTNCIIEQIEKNIFGCKYFYQTSENGHDILFFETEDGVVFNVYVDKNNVITSNYLNEVLKSHKDEIAAITPEGIRMDIGYAIGLYIDSYELFDDAAQLCIDVEQLCDINLDDDIDIDFGLIYVFAFVFCPDCETYVLFPVGHALSTNKQYPSQYEEIYAWLTNSYYSMTENGEHFTHH